MEGPIEQATPADLQNAIEAAGQRAAEEAEKAAKKIVAEMALQLARGTVTARDANGKVQIERPHNTDPDDAFYQVIGASTVPLVGQEVFGATHSGGILLWGAETKSDLVPVATLIEFAGITEPTDGKWLFADGRVRERAEYPELFAAIGTTYATGGETITQFRLPDRRGRVGVGANPAAAGGLPAHPLGERFGEETHTLITAEAPSHSHTITVADDTHSHSTSVTSNTHGHTLDTCGWGGVDDSTSQGWPSGGTHRSVRSTDHNDYVNAWTHDPLHDTTHNHTITVNNDTHGHTASGAAVGGGTAHNNMQPSIAVNYLIRAKP